MTTEEVKIKIKQVVEYSGHNISANGSVNLTLKAMYSDLPETIKLMQLLNEDIRIAAKIAGEKKPKPLGSFRIKNITVDGDGESKLKFNGITEYVELDNLNTLPLNDEDIKQFQVMYVADVEMEGGDDSE
jgi:hypothetical protein